MMMSVLISGPHQPSNAIDVYLRPLVDDLKTLRSSGVELYDAYKKHHRCVLTEESLMLIIRDARL